MRKLCERPGCTGAAEVSYGMDSGALLVWLDNSHVPDREHAGRLCRRHADALTVPKGWTVDDRRVAVPQLFRVVEGGAQDAGAARKRSAPKRTKPESEDAPSLFDGDSAPSELGSDVATGETQVETSAPDPDETRAIPWSPRLVDAMDDDDAPQMGRLLGRAFRQKRSPE